MAARARWRFHDRPHLVPPPAPSRLPALVVQGLLHVVSQEETDEEGEAMITCTCHGPLEPHELGEPEWCCGEEPDEDDADVEPPDYYNREESRYLDRQNARDINRRR